MLSIHQNLNSRLIGPLQSSPFDLVQQMKTSFKPAIPKATRRGVPHRVKIDGEFVQMRSKKQIWSSIGAAKNAVRNHLEGSLLGVAFGTYVEKEQFIRDFLDNHVQYVPISV